MREVVVIDAVRTAIGRRNGAFSGAHATDVLGAVLAAIVERTGIDPAVVGHVVGGCVQQVGMQSGNLTRTAWLGAGLPLEVPASTTNIQCGSSQHAVMHAHGLLAAGLVDVAIACGVEMMTSVPLGAVVRDPELGIARGPEYLERYEFTTQFEGADRIAASFGITRDDTDAWGVTSQHRAAAAWERGAFDDQIVPVPLGADRTPFSRDECLRETSAEALAKLRTNRDAGDAVHTAGTSSQVADGAAAVLLMAADRAQALGLTPRARLVDSVLVGSDPVLMLTGPIPATRALLQRNGIRLGDIDRYEVNEAFASVVLAWAKDVGADPARLNPDGGAIALGHPLGATGVILLTKLLSGLEQADERLGLVSMCCGGGLGTGTLVERL